MSHRLIILPLLTLALVGCVGGQSGTEGPASAPSCVCSAVNGTPLRATIQAMAGDHYELRIDEVLMSGNPELAGRTAVGGTWITGCDDITLGVGDTVLAFYRQGPQASTECTEYRACSVTRCGAQPGEMGTLDDFAAWDQCDEVCLEENRDACTAHEEEAWMNGGLGLARWDTGSWYFGTQGGPALTLADTELPTLLDDVQCQMVFPAPVTRDVMSSGGGGGGSAVASPPPATMP